MERGDRVLVLGATGASGQLAVQVARVFGAGRIVAAGRNVAVLDRLGADATLRVDAPDFGAALRAELDAHGVDIVVDYLWGAPAFHTLEALLAARGKLNRRVRYVNVGQSAGGELALSPHVLRSLDLELSGSGIGAVSFPALAAEVPQVLAAAARGALTIDVDVVPLARVAEAWTAGSAGGKRAVLVP
jgi:NADPH:quinone reductase-like Zn-dependent oxidoreductase